MSLSVCLVVKQSPSDYFQTASSKMNSFAAALTAYWFFLAVVCFLAISQEDVLQYSLVIPCTLLPRIAYTL